MSVQTKLEKYEAYVNEVLRADLETVCREQNRAISDLAEYEQLEKSIELMKEYKARGEVLKTLTDIGCSYFMQTNIEDLSSIIMDVGYGYHLEFTLDEALVYIGAKRKFLDARIAALKDNSAKVKAHIKLMLLYMNKFGDPTDV